MDVFENLSAANINQKRHKRPAVARHLSISCVQPYAIVFLNEVTYRCSTVNDRWIEIQLIHVAHIYRLVIAFQLLWSSIFPLLNTADEYKDAECVSTLTGSDVTRNCWYMSHLGWFQ